MRLVAGNSQMKLIITSLLDSIQPIFSVFLLTFLLQIIFCIVCISFIFNLYDTCYQPNYDFDSTGYVYWVPVRNFSDYFIEYNITGNNTQDVSNFVFMHYIEFE